MKPKQLRDRLEKAGLPVREVLLGRGKGDLGEFFTIFTDGHVLIRVGWSCKLTDAEERKATNRLGRALGLPALMVCTVERETIVENLAKIIAATLYWERWFEDKVPYGIKVEIAHDSPLQAKLGIFESLGFEREQTFEGGYFNYSSTCDEEERKTRPTILYCRTRAMTRDEFKRLLMQLAICEGQERLSLWSVIEPDRELEVLRDVFQLAWFRAIVDCPNPDATSKSKYPMAGTHNEAAKLYYDELTAFVTMWRTSGSYWDWLQDQARYDALLAWWREKVQDTPWPENFRARIIGRAENFLSDLRAAPRFTTFKAAEKALWPVPDKS